MPKLKRVWIYGGLYLATGLMIVLYTWLRFIPESANWFLFGLLTVLALLGQRFSSGSSEGQDSQPVVILIYTGVLLLQPFQFVGMVVIIYSLEWIWERKKKSPVPGFMYLQPYRMGLHLILGLLCRFIYIHLTPEPGNFSNFHSVLAAFLPTIPYALFWHLMGMQLHNLGHGFSRSMIETFSWEKTLTDWMIVIIGIVEAGLLHYNVWLALPALAAFFLICQGLAVPSLRYQASTDAKTGLWNERYFLKVLENELTRSRRFRRPMTVVIADLDLLRNINNTFGHLAGDAVLVGVAKILRCSVRSYDVVARLGGEEFAILMPEIYADDAYQRIENIRGEIAATRFTASTVEQPIRATMSFGIAAREDRDQLIREIIHKADLAVYQAKLSGRNQTCLYLDSSSLPALFSKEEDGAPWAYRVTDDQRKE